MAFKRKFEDGEYALYCYEIIAMHHNLIQIIHYDKYKKKYLIKCMAWKDHYLGEILYKNVKDIRKLNDISWADEIVITHLHSMFWVDHISDDSVFLISKYRRGPRISIKLEDFNFSMLCIKCPEYLRK